MAAEWGGGKRRVGGSASAGRRGERGRYIGGGEIATGRLGRKRRLAG